MRKRSRDPLVQLRQDVRRELYKNDGPIQRIVRPIGRILSRPPTTGAGDVRRYRHGVSLLIFAIFVLVLTAFFLPRDNGRWMFGVFAFLLALAGAWQIDKSRH